MAKVRRINLSQVEGNNAYDNDTNEIRPYGEIGVYQGDFNSDIDNSRLELLMFDGKRTHLKSKVLSPGILYGSNADSGDGYKLDTIKLIPDAELHYNTGNDQYIIVDPTAPNHIHLRAGGTIDGSNADLFLGGEKNHVRVSDGYDHVVISTDDNNTGTKQWVFNGSGDLMTPEQSSIGNQTSLGGQVKIETRSSQGDPSKFWKFDHDGAGSITIPDGGSIRSRSGFNVVVTNTNTEIFTNIRDFDTNSTVDFNIINIVNPETSILNRIDPTSPNFAGTVGAKIRIVYEDYLVAVVPILQAFAANGTDPLNGLPRYSATISVDLGVSASLIKEFSIENTSNWAFNSNGDIQLPPGGDILDSNGASLFRRKSQFVASDTAVTFENIEAKVLSATGQLQVYLNSGTWQATGWTNTYQGGSPTTQYWANVSISDTTGPNGNGYPMSGAMNTQGYGCELTFSDQTNLDKTYKITVIKAGTTGNQWSITIERLV